VTEGTLRVLGLDPQQDGPRIRSRLGVVPQQDSLDTELTVLDNLVIYGRYFGMPRSEARRRAVDLLDFVQLSERANDQVEPLSGGMKRRLTIARSLINEPSLLMLDEPTTGLDPQARHNFWDLIRSIKAEGRTVLLTTHYMEEAYFLCDVIAIMDRGRIIAEGPPSRLLKEHFDDVVLELPREDFGAAAEGFPLPVLVASDRAEILTGDVEATLRLLLDRGVPLRHLRIRPRNLEDLFLELTGRELRT
jgi:lipooligosaccharide transport system ATP-binding protein